MKSATNLKKKITPFTSVIGVGLLIIVGGGLAALTISGTTANAVTSDDTINQVQSGVSQVGGSSNSTDLMTFVQNIIDVLLFIVGVVAVIMIILGAIRYITSNGNPEQAKAARNTILYAVIGLAVAILAFAIVNFVVNKLSV